MSANTKIEWTNASWNPVRARLKNGAGPEGKPVLGWHCTHVSEGCRICYAEKFNQRLGTGLEYKPRHERDIEIFLDDAMLAQPLRWKKSRMIFVCSMTDLFADFVPDSFIDRVFAVMNLRAGHTFQILTKRPERMLAWFKGDGRRSRGDIVHSFADLMSARWARGVKQIGWPLPNVWLGVSVEDQAAADERIPLLLQTPAAKRFLSCEPLLGPLDLYNGDPDPRLGGHEATATYIGDWWPPGAAKGQPSNHGVDWVIVGGESGPRARPMHPDWVRSLRDQCAAAEVPFFFKQWGEHALGALNDNWTCVANNGALLVNDPRLDVQQVTRVGKKRAGRLLDGVEHNEFPEAA